MPAMPRTCLESGHDILGPELRLALRGTARPEQCDPVEWCKHQCVMISVGATMMRSAVGQTRGVLDQLGQPGEQHANGWRPLER